MNTETETSSGTTADAAPAPQVWPAIQATDAHGLIEFLVTAFGFEKVVVYADGDTVHHAQLAWPPGGGIMLGSHDPEGEWSRSPGTFGGYAVTDDPDALYERAKTAGARIVRELQNEDYGNREFAAADPEGNLWSFGTYRGEPHGG